MSQESIDPSLLKAFFIESTDTLDALERDLSSLEENPLDENALNSFFRGLHTIKGNSSFLDLEAITKLAHKSETMLDKLRKKEMAFTSQINEICRMVLDDLRSLIVDQNLDWDITTSLGAIDKALGTQTGAAPKTAAPAAPFANQAGIKKDSVKPKIQTSVVRLDEARFDRIVNLVSELELFRNSLELIPDRLELLGEVAADVRFDLDLVVSKLAHTARSLSSLVLGAKLVPVNQVFTRFSKVVNDLAAKLNKKINLEIRNGDAELDKNIVDAIADPMTHLIRNSADHGIETKEERIKRGKPEAGKIVLNSYVKGNFVYIEIADDGRGIDPEKIVNKAIEKGIMPIDKAMKLSEAQKLGLIFAPGFSTAEQVTDISGRGVGMDVVKSNINRLKGSVLINSRVGQGTVIQLRFPMSLVVMYSLFIEVNNSPCAIPLDQVEESCDYKRTELTAELPKREPDKHMGLYSLSQLLWGKNPSSAEQCFHVLRFKGYDNIGFIVDDFLSIEEALVQSVDSYIAALPGVQGATIRKDGTVSLVLNTEVLVALTKKVRPLAYAKRREKIPIDEAAMARYLPKAANG